MFQASRLVQASLCLLLSFYTLSSNAINLTEYRIYLDRDNRTKSFLIHNKEVEPQDCKLDLKHYNFDEKSKMTLHKSDELPENSAKDWIRFSPKTFVLTPGQAQTIRFTLRRKAKAEPAEYRSYLQIDCGVQKHLDPEKGQTTGNIAIKPKLMHNVPIIARVGRLKASIDFKNLKYNNGQLTFDIERSGNRSIYGKIELIDKNTNEILAFKDNISVYTEANLNSVKLGTKDTSLTDILIRFTENKKYGGEIVYTKPAART